MAKIFGELLKDYRNKAGFTQKQLAEQLHCHHTYVSHLEKDRQDPPNDPNFVESIARVLMITAEERKRLMKAAFGAEKEGLGPVLGHVKWAIERTPGLDEEITEFIQVRQQSETAKKAYEAGEFQDADKAFRDVLKQSEKIAARWRLDNRWFQATMAYRGGKIQKAINLYTEALDYARSQNNKSMIARIVPILGDAYRRLGRWKFAEDMYEEGLELAGKLDDLELQMKCLRKKAGLLLFQGRAPEAGDLCRESCQIAEKELEDKGGEAKALQHLAWAESYSGNLDESARLHRRALELGEEIGDERIVLKGKRYLADTCRMMGQLDEAERLYAEALESLEASPATAGRLVEGAIKSGLANTYRLRRAKFDEAREYLQDSLEIHMELGDDYRLGITLNDIGLFEMAQGDPEDRAELFFSMAEEKFEQIRNDYYTVAALVNMAELHKLKETRGGHFKSRRFASKAIREAQKHKFYNHLSRAQATLAEVMIAAEQYDKARQTCSHALDNASKFNKYLLREIEERVWQQEQEFKRRGKWEEADRLLELLEKGPSSRGELPEADWLTKVSKERQEVGALKEVASPKEPSS